MKDTRLEMACGEAPYLVSRYGVVSGMDIPIKERIGILDRKLRVVSENVDNVREWIKCALRARSRHEKIISLHVVFESRHT